VIQLSVATPLAGRSFAGHAPPLVISAVDLNEVFAEFYRYSAYDSVAFRGLFSVLHNVVLGLSHLPATGSHNLAPGLSFLSHATKAGTQTCALDELDVAVGATQEPYDNTKDEFEMLQARLEGFLVGVVKLWCPLTPPTFVAVLGWRGSTKASTPTWLLQSTQPPLHLRLPRTKERRTWEKLS
jgi:hypothetical protein